MRDFSCFIDNCLSYATYGIMCANLLRSRIFMSDIKFIRYGFYQMKWLMDILDEMNFLGILELVIVFIMRLFVSFLLLELGWVCFSCKAKLVKHLYVRNRFDQYYYFLYLFEKVRKEGRLFFVSFLNCKGDEFMRL